MKLFIHFLCFYYPFDDNPCQDPMTLTRVLWSWQGSKNGVWGGVKIFCPGSADVRDCWGKFWGNFGGNDGRLKKVGKYMLGVHMVQTGCRTLPVKTPGNVIDPTPGAKKIGCSFFGEITPGAAHCTNDSPSWGSKYVNSHEKKTLFWKLSYTRVRFDLAVL